MSDTTTPAPAGDTTPADTSGLDELGAALDQEGLLPTSTSDDAPEADDTTDDDGEPKVKLKINGKVVEKTQAEVVRLAQLYSATEMKLETAKKEIEAARETKKTLETQQSAVRELLGVMQRGDIEKLTEFVTDSLGSGDAWNKAIIQHALKLYEISKMSPEQRQAMQDRKTVEKLRREAQEREKMEEERAYQMEVNNYSQRIAIEIPKAMQEVGLRDTRMNRDYVISTWRSAIERGQQPTAIAVAAFVKNRLDEDRSVAQTAAKPIIQPRPKATRESVGMKKTNGKDTGYESWDSWKATRGH